jgi:two-component system, cell cycle sensor histidine kinase and response regulator CckA
MCGGRVAPRSTILWPSRKDRGVGESSSETAVQQIQRFRDRLRVASEATRAFAEATTDYERLLDSVARILSEVIRDSCAVFLLAEDAQSLRLMSLHAGDAVADEQIRGTLQTSLLLSEHPALSEVLQTGAALLVARLAPGTPRSDTTEEQVRMQDKLGLHSYLLVALRSHGRAMGILSLGRFRPESPPFDEQDRELAQNLADHASLAIENAQLYQAAQTAQRAAELARATLERSERRNRFFFESSPSASFVLDVSSLRLIDANQAALDLYGYTRSEFLALSLDDLRAPEEPLQLPAGMQAAEHADLAGSARHRRKDGSVILVDGKNHFTMFEGRRARCVVVHDHTERLLAEAAQRASEGRLRRTLDNMMEGYTILSYDLRYLFVNKVGAEQARLTERELLGRSPMDLYPDFQSTGMCALLQRCLKERVPVRAEEELTLADGSKVYFEVNVQPTSEGLVVLSLDTTERRRSALARDSLEEQLRQSQRMDAVGRLAGGVAHDFNNILSIILGYGEGLLEDLKPGDPMRTDVQEIHRAALRAAELTKQLLMFSRQQVMETKVLDMNEVLGSMEKMLRRILGEQLELRTLLDPELGRIRADRGNVEQIIMNLAVNAKDAMPDGGKLTIETSNVVLDDTIAHSHLGTEPGPYVLLAVTDTGIGMDKATRLRIFEPFFTTKAQGKGTGLGLSTVFGIVQQSRGAVWVYSEPGQGSTFKVYLPRTDEAVVAARPSLAPQNLRGHETVLLVEDEEAVRGVAQRMLERYGYRVLVAQNPGDALLVSELHDQRIDLLLTDVVMPRMNGAELASRFLTRWPQLKVLYMSGYTDASVVARGVLESDVPFLQKPFTSDQFARKVRSVLDGDALLPGAELPSSSPVALS